MDVPAYTAPLTLEDALRLKKELGTDARVIAGGTDLILKMRDEVYSPRQLIDLQKLSLDSISLEPDHVAVGCNVTHSRLLASADVNELYPALVEACREFAGPPIRNRGTIGGNIVNASPAADLVPSLMVYDARVVLTSFGNAREVALAEFFEGPGQTVMAPDEILTEVRLAKMSPATAATFIKLGQRRSMAISMVSVATRLTLDDNGSISAARIVLGSVAPTPIHASTAEKSLQGNAPSVDLLRHAATMAGNEATPISDVRASETYRNNMTEVLVRRALLANLAGLRRSMPSD
jgi:carbon-monoxide dehydrogenase medium subunit